MILLSVIVPFYNASCYIGRCATSLMEQTLLENIEFIFVNDGSTDASLQALYEVLDRYPLRADQVIVISYQENKGVAFARCKGMLSAHGEYIIQCDADDWVDQDAYSLLCAKILETKADVVVLPFIHEFGTHQQIEVYQHLSIEECFINQRWWGLCSHALRFSLIKKHQLFPDPGLDFWEDLYLLMRYFVHAHSIAYVSQPLYHYDRTVTGSIVHQMVGTKGILQCQSVISRLKDYFEQLAPQYIYSLVFLKRATRDLYLQETPPDLYSWSRCYPETWRVVWTDSQLSLAYRVCYLLGSFRLTFPLRFLLLIAKTCRRSLS